MVPLRTLVTDSTLSQPRIKQRTRFLSHGYTDTQLPGHGLRGQHGPPITRTIRAADYTDNTVFGRPICAEAQEVQCPPNRVSCVFRGLFSVACFFVACFRGLCLPRAVGKLIGKRRSSTLPSGTERRWLGWNARWPVRLAWRHRQRRRRAAGRGLPS